MLGRDGRHDNDVATDNSATIIEEDEEEVVFLESLKLDSDECHSLVKSPPGEELLDRPTPLRQGQKPRCGVTVMLIGWLLTLALGFCGGYQYHAHLTTARQEKACPKVQATTTDTDSATDTGTPTITPTTIPMATPTTPPSYAPTPLPSYPPTVSPSHIPTPSPNLEQKETNKIVCDCAACLNNDATSPEDNVQDGDDDDDDEDDDGSEQQQQDEEQSKMKMEDPGATTKCEEETGVFDGHLCHNDTRTPPRVSFVFLSGIEGSGHHLYSDLYRKSPSFRWLFPEALDVPEGNDEAEYYTSEISRAVRDVIHSLFRTPALKKGLFSASCAMHLTGLSVDGQKLFTKLVQSLRTAQELVQAKLKKEPRDRIAIPLNSVSKLQPKGSGMMSYPNFNGPCRAILIPDLDLLYQACEEAQVSCQHIVIFRDAYEVIRSTTRRRHFDTPGHQMTLMHPLLNMIATNIEDYSQHTAGCWDFNHAETPPWDVGRTMGWLNRTEFEKVYHGTFQAKRRPISSDEDRDRVVPAKAQIFITGMVRATERLRQTCFTAVKSCHR